MFDSQFLPAAAPSSLDMELLRSQLACYLARHPEERNALRALTTQFYEENGSLLTARSNMRGHLTSSLLLLDPSQTHALLIEHKHIGAWIPPGGHHEGDLSLWLSALREAEEETGFPRALAIALDALTRGGQPQPLDIDSHPIAARPAKGEGPHCHHDFMFAARATARFEPTPQEEEVFGAKWIPLSRLASMPNPRMAKVASKLRALGLNLSAAATASRRSAPRLA